MISLGSATRVFIVTGHTDMRKSFNGLYAIVKHKLEADPTSGHLYVFCNRSRNRVKLLVWDGSGLWVCANSHAPQCTLWFILEFEDPVSLPPALRKRV